MAAMTAWVTHPITWVSLLVMALNDHVLKAAFATGWTGKLSDVAGLIFAPAIVAWFIAALVPRWRGARAAALGIVLTGIGFVGANATPAGGRVAEQMWSAFGVPTQLWADPTDLWCLPALAVAWLVFRRVSERADATVAGPMRAVRPRARRDKARRVGAWLVLPFAVLAAAATSRSDGSEPRDYEFPTRVEEVGRARALIAVAGLGEGLLIINPDTLQPSTLQNPSLLGEFTQSTMSCVPSEPAICYRVVPGHMAIESSADAGATWTLEWSVSEANRARMADAYGDRRGTALVTTSVVAADAEGGHIVLGANGVDGVVARHVDGTWERMGFFDGAEPLELGEDAPTVASAPATEGAPAASDARTSLATDSAPYPLVWGVMATIASATWLAAIGGWRRVSAGIFAAGVLVGALGVALAMVSGQAATPSEFTRIVAVALLCGIGGVCAVGGAWSVGPIDLAIGARASEAMRTRLLTRVAVGSLVTGAAVLVVSAAGLVGGVDRPGAVTVAAVVGLTAALVQIPWVRKARQFDLAAQPAQ